MLDSSGADVSKDVAATGSVEMPQCGVQDTPRLIRAKPYCVETAGVAQLVAAPRRAALARSARMDVVHLSWQASPRDVRI